MTLQSKSGLKAAGANLARKIPYLLVCLGIGLPGSILGGNLVRAQSIVPTSDGTGTQVSTPDGQRYIITGGTPAGANLFHSFQQFGLNRGEGANFFTNPQIQNILGRVVGGNPSTINGLIQVVGGGSNLYLINPAGIVFGPNAQLNVPASFTATTATGIGFAGNAVFHAVGTPNYAQLVGNPTFFQFATPQPGGIINAGQLRVGAGQSLNLLGGTVINTGILSAPGGQVTVAAVPGSSLVRLSQGSSLLSLDIQPLPANASALPLPFSPATLPQLLTGGGLVTNAKALTVNPDGTVSLQGSGLGINPGDVVSAQAGSLINAQQATLQAAQNLTLAETQLITTSDLNLLATGTVRGRDSEATPFLAQAGGNLLVQGNQGIDILALNHPPKVALQSQGRLTLASDGLISGDANFSSGGPFTIRSVSGGLANFRSLYDPIISANSDVDIAADYTGASLLVEATGSIRFQDNVTITGPDTGLITPGPDTALLTSSSALILRSGQASLSYAAGSYDGATLAPVFSASAVPAGITVAGTITLNTPVSGNATVSLTAAAGDISTQGIVTNGGQILMRSNGSITTNGQALTTNNGSGSAGAINLVAGGDITLADVSAFVVGSGNTGNGGTITLTAGGNLTTGGLRTDIAIAGDGNSGHGGAITLNAGGNLTSTGIINSLVVINGNGNAGSGGAIFLNAGGNLTTVGESSYSSVGNFTSVGTIVGGTGSSGNGGTIALLATNNLTTLFLQSFTRVFNSGNTGNGGATTLSAGNDLTAAVVVDTSSTLVGSGNSGSAGSLSLQAGGNLTAGTLNSFVVLGSGNGGNSGPVALTAGGQISAGTVTATLVVSNGNVGNGGGLVLNAGGNLSIGKVDTSVYVVGDGTVGNGGGIVFTAGGNLTSSDQIIGRTQVDGNGTAANGSSISLNAVGNLTLSGDLFSYALISNNGNASNGGSIQIKAGGDLTTRNLTSTSRVKGNGNSSDGGSLSLQAGGILSTGTLKSYSIVEGTGNSGNGGRITVEAGGNLTAGSLFSNSTTPIGNSLNGGDVRLNSRNVLTVNEIDSRSNSAQGSSGNGGAITLNATVVNLLGNLTTNDRTILFTAPVLLGNTITLTAGSQGGVTFQSTVSSSTVASGLTLNAGSFSSGNITLTGGFTFNTPSSIVLPNVASNGGLNVSSSAGSIRAGDLSTASATGSGQFISLKSPRGEIITGALDTSGVTQAGAITLQSGISINAGQIRANASQGNGGSVLLDPQNDIQVAWINAQGGSNGVGGTVTIATDRLLRATDTFTDLNGLLASISVAGGAGPGAVTIQHGGGDIIPLTVGRPTLNGFAGAITTGVNSLQPLFIIPGGNFSLGNIRVSSTFSAQSQELVAQLNRLFAGQGQILTANVLAGDPLTTLDLGAQELEERFTSEYVDYLQTKKPPIKSLPETIATLDAIETLTGSRSAILYISFVPNDIHGPQRDPGGDRLEILAITARGKVIRQPVPGATRARVLQAAKQFQQRITGLEANYLASAQQLYQWLITPVETELREREVNTLVLLLDSGLRTLPLAALHDGKQFLIEKYSLAEMPSLSLTSPGFTSLKNAPVLAMGASKFTNLLNLPGVPTELLLITGSNRSSQAFLNEQFTLANLQAQRRQAPFPILHLATHSEFNGGKVSESYIQLWDTRLHLDQLETLKLRNPLVELLVLSGCQTAIGNREAELGFSGMAYHAGVRSVLGSLWSVSDAGTLALMREFYRQLETAPTRSEALRQAQIALLRGQVKFTHGQLLGSGSPVNLPEDIPGRDGQEFKHPFYWSAFTLVGSPW